MEVTHVDLKMNFSLSISVIYTCIRYKTATIRNATIAVRRPCRVGRNRESADL